ncbi:MAG: TerB family tellurite resistance protein, partial [Deltaproteobacteria bacterium]|nr:TerB family tellurite resistance protein [Deltaproteobacteria bacterium]
DVMSDEVPSKLQQKVTDSLNDMFERTINDRKKHFVDHPHELPQRKDIDAIINKWANTNAVVTPLRARQGLWECSPPPEIVAVIGNQTKMIFDLGVAHGQHRFLRSELVIGILMSSMGSGGGSLLAVQGGKLLVRRASLRVMQKVIAMLGGKVTQQLLKSMVGKWLPVVGAAAMAAWARYTTKKLGEHACEMLSKEIVDGGEVGDEAETVATEAPRAATEAPITAHQSAASGDRSRRIEIANIRALTNVMLADQQAAPEEVAFIEALIEGSELGDAEREGLRQVVTAGKRTEVDYAALSESPEDRAGLLFSMVGLAKRDGNVHLAERLYIKQVAKQLGFSEADVTAAFDAEMPASAIPIAPVQIPWRVEASARDPEFNVNVDLTVSGQVTVIGVWDEAVSWVAEQCGRIARGRAFAIDHEPRVGVDADR